MESFFATLAGWIILMLAFTFFFGAFILSNPYIAAVVAAVFLAVLTRLLMEQSRRISQLEERIRLLEEKGGE
jgi:O-antigen/teichoic acid export membrane protein